MDDLIRRGDVLGNINKRRYYFGKAALDEAFKAVYKVPTVDAVPVVRCKDCEHRCPESITAVQHCTLSGIQTEDDDFCSYGAKMDGGAE